MILKVGGRHVFPDIQKELYVRWTSVGVGVANLVLANVATSTSVAALDGTGGVQCSRCRHWMACRTVGFAAVPVVA